MCECDQACTCSLKVLVALIVGALTALVGLALYFVLEPSGLDWVGSIMLLPETNWLGGVRTCRASLPQRHSTG